MCLNIYSASYLRYVQPIPEGDGLDRLEKEVNAQDKSLEDVYFPLFPNDPDWEEHLAGMRPGL